MPCIEKLQSFYKVKKHTETQMEFRDLTVASSGEMFDIQNFDPKQKQQHK